MKSFNHFEAYTFTSLKERIFLTFRLNSHVVHPSHWQGVDVSSKPDAVTHELMNVVVHIPKVRQTIEELQTDIKPNLPWADDHFKERVCGYPLNPGKTWEYWVRGQNASKFLDEDGMFNHTYSERLWPKYAGTQGATKTVDDFLDSEGMAEWEACFVPQNEGIRGKYGDLNSVVELLVAQPLTRQAYMPMFMHEDVGIGDGGRKPCSLIWGFTLRENELHICYFIRSCDVAHHFNDDCYLAIRLGMWVLDQCKKKSDDWKSVTIGSYTMYITSLHLFENDYRRILNP